MTVFEYKTYKDFLQATLGGKKQRKGQKSALAKALGCQPTYISQVVHSSADFSLEQAEKAARFLGLSKEEQNYFLALVQKDRAGTNELKAHFSERLQELLEKRLTVKERLGHGKALTKEDQSIYYSSWHYAAAHIAVTIPELQSRERLSSVLRVPKKRMREVLDFLEKTGLIKEEAGKLSPGPTQIRLGNESENIIKHHTNWRLRALDSLDKEDIRELHYSAVVSLSKTDVIKVKDLILANMKENIEVIKASKEEELYCYAVDFFNIGNER
ncbi:MAG: TIGR02147 family protein [Bacteriovoracia bacterium]